MGILTWALALPRRGASSAEPGRPVAALFGDLLPGVDPARLPGADESGREAVLRALAGRHVSDRDVARLAVYVDEAAGRGC